MENQIRNLLLAEDNLDEYVDFISAINTLSPLINVTRADDGYNLLNLLQTLMQVDAIFLDINMKYKNGLLCLMEIREMEHLKHVPVVMLSKSDFKINIDLAFKYGATFFVKKPETFGELKTVLAELFSNPNFISGVQPSYDLFFIS